MTTPLRHIGALTIALTIALGANFAYSAWTSPTAAPPNDNVAAPINTGTVDQVKNGGLSVDALSVVGDAAVTGSLNAADGVTGNEISIGECAFGTCSWPMETINLPDTRNLRINFGDTQKLLLENSGILALSARGSGGDGAQITLRGGDTAGGVLVQNQDGNFRVRSDGSDDFIAFRDGRVGASQYCDIDGENCFTASEGGGTTGAGGNTVSGGIIPGWPDVIVCEYNSGANAFVGYIDFVPGHTAGTFTYRAPASGGAGGSAGYAGVWFNPDGSYHSVDPVASNNTCVGKSITQLSADGQAFFLGGASGDMTLPACADNQTLVSDGGSWRCQNPPVSPSSDNGTSKICSVTNGTSWRDTINVPRSWTDANCSSYMTAVKANGYTLGCVTPDGFTFGDTSACD